MVKRRRPSNVRTSEQVPGLGKRDSLFRGSSVSQLRCPTSCPARANERDIGNITPDTGLDLFFLPCLYLYKTAACECNGIR